jgi:quercetin dioxygenase-like cupin family protein
VTGLALVLFIAGWTTAAIAAPPPPSVETLLATRKTVLDQDIVYPPGQAEVTVEVITYARGASTNLHLHQVPLVVHVLEGVLVVDYESAGKRRYHKGDTFVEAMDTPHRGRAAGRTPTKILVVYAGAVGIPNREAVDE